MESHEGLLRQEFEQLSRIKFELEEQDAMIFEMLNRDQRASVPASQLEVLRDLFGEISPLCQGYKPPSIDTNNPDGVRPLIRSVRAKVDWRLKSLRGQPLALNSMLAPQSHAVPGNVDPRKVFVVYGRNTEARDAMFRFLRAIDLDPIEWEQAVALTGEASPYIGDVLDAGLSRAQAAVVLITGDDLARLGSRYLKPDDKDFERNLTPQARPNVLLEAGMALGRYSGRTIIVELGSTRAFSDIVGRNTIRLSDDASTRHALAGRLRSVGCKVNTEHRQAWITEGSFNAANCPPDSALAETFADGLGRPAINSGGHASATLTVDTSLPVFGTSCDELTFEWGDHISLRVNGPEVDGAKGFVCAFINNRPEYLESYSVEVVEAQCWNATHQTLIPIHEFVRQQIDKSGKFGPITRSGKRWLVKPVVRQKEPACLSVGSGDQGKLVWPNNDPSLIEIWRLTVVVLYKPLNSNQVPLSHVHFFLRWDRDSGALQMAKWD
jgi:predicted nucleotide-binding protein